MAEREFDVVLFGASGFVGKLTARHLAEHAGDGVRIALAGRSEAKLASVRMGLPGAAKQWPLIAADSSDADAMKALAERTKVVATTVGPYVKYGLSLLKACAAAGTHYADLTGELLFVREAIDTSHETAMASGAHIVNSCAFDSIPSDLGVLLLNNAVVADGAGELERVVFVVESMRGGASGGTVASLLGQAEEMRRSKEARGLVMDPYALSPDPSAEAQLGRQLDGMSHDELAGQWVAPFFMGPYNSRVVRRSNALSGFAYGKAMRYSEVMAMGEGPLGAAKAVAVTGALAVGFSALLGLPRKLVDRVVPAPGEGPSEQSQQNGFFNIKLYGRTSTGARYTATVKAKGDPGYAATAVMFGESALCLALDTLPDGVAGVVTPATAMGTVLADRLRTRGFTFEAARA